MISVCYTIVAISWSPCLCKSTFWIFGILINLLNVSSSMFSILSTGSGFGSRNLSFRSPGSYMACLVFMKSETKVAAELNFWVSYLACYGHIISRRPTTWRLGAHMLELQQRAMKMALKKIINASELILPWFVGPFWVYWTFCCFTVRDIISCNKMSYRFLPNTYARVALRRSAANEMVIGCHSCLKK